ncbi:ATP-binding cassette domain-containing protein [Ferrimicrobium sp.]|uniref:ATP-binding cassette domain-containing protein n=1 Tax=Ferrimicrobium sp. TaxID=2926050 RepID=UPI0026168388|nr:ATP-binding cassette domain-containing protein [Ferrimicrobium sp.]
MIEAHGLTKTYEGTLAVDHLDFQVVEGRVTGFLGPNGAGKSTTMRMIMGLDHPSEGSVLINGQHFSELKNPLRTIGALLEAKAYHPGRTARNHLLALAATNHISKQRVDEVLDLVGLTSVADRRAGTFSLGMGQRLGIAAALLGDAPLLLFDEPVNGLDPEGILWIRHLLRGLAAEGRGIFVSSHLMSEMALTADHVVVIGRGKLVADTDMTNFIDANSGKTTLVRTPRRDELQALLAQRGATMTNVDPDGLQVTGLETAAIGEIAFSAGIVLHELASVSASLEDAFMSLMQDDVEFQSHTAVQLEGERA